MPHRIDRDLFRWRVRAFARLMSAVLVLALVVAVPSALVAAYRGYPQVALMDTLALAWILAQGDDVVAIPGTRSAKRVEENVAAADLTLGDADLARISEIFPPVDSVPATSTACFPPGTSPITLGCASRTTQGLFGIPVP